MKLFRFLFLGILIVTGTGKALACEEAKIRVSSCISSVTWDFSNYTQVLDVCAESKITDVKVWCKSATAYINTITVIDLTMNQSYSFGSTINFQPVNGHHYRLVINATGPNTGSIVEFMAVTCQNIDVSQQIFNPNTNSYYTPSCLLEGYPIDFSFDPPGDDLNCYVYTWDFGDGSPHVYNAGSTPQHQYNFANTASFSGCRPFTVSLYLTLNDPYTCANCPECFTISKTIEVCQRCLPDIIGFPTIDVIALPNPTSGRFTLSIEDPGGSELDQLFVVNIETGELVFSEEFEPDLIFPYEHAMDLSFNEPGLYEITVVSEGGGFGKVTVVLEN